MKSFKRITEETNKVLESCIEQMERMTLLTKESIEKASRLNGELEAINQLLNEGIKI